MELIRMIKRIVFWVIFIAFYIIFFKILQFIWDELDVQRVQKLLDRNYLLVLMVIQESKDPRASIYYN